MKSRWIKLFVLACITYWVTGAAQYIHEKIEHEPDAVAAFSLFKARAAGIAYSAYQRAVESEDDCPTCQSLHMMKAPASALPTVPDTSESLIATLLVSAWQVPAVCVPLYLPARGPPLV